MSRPSFLPPPPSIGRPRLPSLQDAADHAPAKQHLPFALALALAFGDLGTNPLFALAEAFGGERGLHCMTVSSSE